MERRHFILLVSSITETELKAGVFPRQAECLKLIRRLRFLPMTKAVREFTSELLGSGIVPSNKAGDAAQLGLSCVHQVDYLLSWNYAHLANPVVQERLAVVCKEWQLPCPYLVSSESIPQIRWGQDIRRSK